MVYLKTYIFDHFCQQYLVLLTMVPRNTMRDRPLIGIVRTIGSGSDILVGIVTTIEFKRAVLFESRQLLVELHS